MRNSILVIDDEPTIRTLLSEMLGLEGHHVLTAGTATEALALLRNTSASLLLVDVQLPDMDGVTLLRQAFQLDNRLIGVVMTGHGSIDVAVRAMKAGASDFLTKPFQTDVVLLTIKRLLEVYRLRYENTVLKHALIRSGNIRLQQLALTDFGASPSAADSGYRTDYQRGLADGEQQAVQHFGDARQREHQLLTNAIRTVEDTAARLHQQVEQEVIDLSLRIAQKILREVVHAHRDLVVEQVRQALAHVHESGVIRIVVHPSDVPTMETAKAAVMESLDHPVSLKIEPDSNVSPGGCLIQTSSRLVDATLETQLTRLGEALQRSPAL